MNNPPVEPEFIVEYRDERSGRRERVTVWILQLALDLASDLAAIGAEPIVQVKGPNGWAPIANDL